MIRFCSTAMLLLITSVWGVDAVHGWSHVELSDHHQHCHDDAGDCRLCDWDFAVVPEPADLQLIPTFAPWPVRLEVATIGDEAGMESVQSGLLPTRGPPQKA